MLGVTSRGIARLPFLTTFLGERVVYQEVWFSRRECRAIAGWGCRPSTARSKLLAKRKDIGYIALEDGYLRSFGTGERFPPLSMVIDELGIYYDSTHASALERLLDSALEVLDGIADEVSRAKLLVLGHRLSKYNHAPDLAGLPLSESLRGGGNMARRRESS